MKRPRFLHGVCAAALLALVGSVAAAALSPLLGSAVLYKLLVAALGLGYVLYLLCLTSERVGKVTILTLWAVMALTLWLLEPPLAVYLLTHTAALWLIRSLYFYASAVAALLDIGLNLLAVATGYWAAVHTGSVFLSIWCFFLVQALFVAIPPTLKNRSRSRSGTHLDTGQFDRARRRAEAAIRQLLAQ